MESKTRATNTKQHTGANNKHLSSTEPHIVHIHKVLDAKYKYYKADDRIKYPN